MKLGGAVVLLVWGRTTRGLVVGPHRTVRQASMSESMEEPFCGVMSDDRKELASAARAFGHAATTREEKEKYGTALSSRARRAFEERWSVGEASTVAWALAKSGQLSAEASAALAKSALEDTEGSGRDWATLAWALARAKRMVPGVVERACAADVDAYGAGEPDVDDHDAGQARRDIVRVGPCRRRSDGPSRGKKFAGATTFLREHWRLRRGR